MRYWESGHLDKPWPPNTCDFFPWCPITKGLLVGGVKPPLALTELGLIVEYEFIVQPKARRATRLRPNKPKQGRHPTTKISDRDEMKDPTQVVLKQWQ